MPISIEVAAQLAKQARKFAESDRRPHPHDLPLIPSAMLLAAQVYAEAGNQDEALSLLKDVRKYGGVDVEMLKKPEFDSLRESEEFSQIVAFGEAETDDQMFAGYLIQSPPLFPLKDLLMLESEPSMPSANSTQGKVTVVYTGPKLTPDAIETLKEATEAGATAHAIVTEAPTEPVESIAVHVIDASPEKLSVGGTPITWFSGKDNQVVAYLRPFSGAGFAKAIVKQLIAQQQ